jgi:hypothetical protein
VAVFQIEPHGYPPRWFLTRVSFVDKPARFEAVPAVRVASIAFFVCPYFTPAERRAGSVPVP